MMLLALTLQAATVAAAPPPQKWSVLVPIANEPCVRQAAKDQDGHDIVICGNALPSQKLPYPDEVEPDGPVPFNPYKTGSGALAAQATPCPISRSCVVGFGPPLIPMIKGAVDVAKRAFAKRPDKSGRVAIPLDATDTPTGHLEP